MKQIRRWGQGKRQAFLYFAGITALSAASTHAQVITTNAYLNMVDGVEYAFGNGATIGIAIIGFLIGLAAIVKGVKIFRKG